MIMIMMDPQASDTHSRASSPQGPQPRLAITPTKARGVLLGGMRTVQSCVMWTSQLLESQHSTAMLLPGPFMIGRSPLTE